MNPRYAIYYAPALDSAWWAFGRNWLSTQAPGAPPPARPSLGAGVFERITAAPARYGFHATLKAPFHLHAGDSAQTLLDRLGSLAQTLRPVPLGILVPVFMDGFVALVPSDRNPALAALAEACVTALDDLRAPLTAADLRRRDAAALDERGRELLERFGYPHVMERFRFHMTLTGPVDIALAGQVVAHVARPVAQLNAKAPPVLDRLCVFMEPAAGAQFQRLAEVELPS